MYDVVNKTILRSVKRFLLTKFRENNPKLRRTRYSQCRAATIYQATKDMCKELFGDIPQLSEISQFVMVFMALKAKTRYPFDRKIQCGAEEALSCLYSYSNYKFEKLICNPEFKFIALNLLDYHNDKVFQDKFGVMAKNATIYNDSITNLRSLLMSEC